MSNQDDFGDAPDDGDFDTDLDSDFEEFDQDKTLGDLWKNPIVKMGTVLGGFLVVVGSILLFGGGDEQTDKSRVSSAPEVKQTPGTAKVSENYEQAVREKNRDVIREAERRGESAIPVPVDPTRESMPAKQEQDQQEQDPLQRWRQLQQQRADSESPEQDEPEQQVNQQRLKQIRQARKARAKTMNNLAKSMAEQMQSIMEAQAIKGMRQTRVPATKNKLQKGKGGQGQQQASPGARQQQQQQGSAETLLGAGTIEYGQLLIEANSDTQGPIMAQISTGPFKGARLIGSFQTKQERFITMKFSTMAHEDETYSINAVALDPNTTLSGMATEVDRRYFRRIVLPAAAEFLEGVGEGISKSATTTTNTGSGSTVQETDALDTEQELARGAEEGFSEFGDFLDDEASNIRPLIRVEAGTPIGVFFTQPVTSQSANSGARASGAANALQQRGRASDNQQSFSQRAEERLRETGSEQLEQTGDNALDQLDFLQQLQNQ